MRKAVYVFLLVLAILFGLATLTQLSAGRFFKKEMVILPKAGDPYDQTLLRLNSMKKLEGFIDSIAFERAILPVSTYAYVELVDSVVSMRFYHGLQYYEMHENILAYLLGRYVWFDFSAKVIPDHILSKQHAFCSQSSIVFQELLKRKSIPIRTVGLPGHFCSEVMVNGQWGFYDVNLKPRFESKPRLSTAELLANPEYLAQAYSFSFDEGFAQNLERYFDAERIFFGEVNAFAAPRMFWVHRITHILSWFGWAIFLALALIYRYFFLLKKII